MIEHLTVEISILLLATRLYLNIKLTLISFKLRAFLKCQWHLAPPNAVQPAQLSPHQRETHPKEQVSHRPSPLSLPLTACSAFSPYVWTCPTVRDSIWPFHSMLTVYSFIPSFCSCSTLFHTDKCCDSVMPSTSLRNHQAAHSSHTITLPSHSEGSTEWWLHCGLHKYFHDN